MEANHPRPGKPASELRALSPAPLKIRCSLCRRWLPGNDRLPTPVGLSHAACVMAFQAAKLTLTKET